VPIQSVMLGVIHAVLKLYTLQYTEIFLRDMLRDPLEGLCFALCRVCFTYQDSTPVLWPCNCRSGQTKLAVIGHSVQAIIFPYIAHCTHTHRHTHKWELLYITLTDSPCDIVCRITRDDNNRIWRSGLWENGFTPTGSVDLLPVMCDGFWSSSPILRSVVVSDDFCNITPITQLCICY